MSAYWYIYRQKKKKVGETDRDRGNRLQAAFSY